MQERQQKFKKSKILCKIDAGFHAETREAPVHAVFFLNTSSCIHQEIKTEDVVSCSFITEVVIEKPYLQTAEKPVFRLKKPLPGRQKPEKTL